MIFISNLSPNGDCFYLRSINVEIKELQSGHGTVPWPLVLSMSDALLSSMNLSNESSGAIDLNKYEYIPFASSAIGGNSDINTVHRTVQISFTEEHDFAFGYGVMYIRGGYSNQSNRNPSGWVLLKAGQSISIPAEGHTTVFTITFNSNKKTLAFAYHGWFAGGTFYYAGIGV